MKKKLIRTMVVLVLICLIAGGAGISMLIERYRPTTDREDLYTYFNIEENNTEDVILFLQDEDYIPERTEEMAKLSGEYVYLPYEIVKKECNNRFYWDESAQTMVFTTPYDIYKYPLGSKSYTVNGIEENYECEIVKQIKGELYVSLDYVKEKSDILGGSSYITSGARCQKKRLLKKALSVCLAALKVKFLQMWQRVKNYFCAMKWKNGHVYRTSMG